MVKKKLIHHEFHHKLVSKSIICTQLTGRILPKNLPLGCLENRLDKASNTNKKKFHQAHTVRALIANCIIFFKHEIQLSVSLVYVIITLESTENNEYI